MQFDISAQQQRNIAQQNILEAFFLNIKSKRKFHKSRPSIIFLRSDNQNAYYIIEARDYLIAVVVWW